jgi:hypothetical protein
MENSEHQIIGVGFKSRSKETVNASNLSLVSGHFLAAIFSMKAAIWKRATINDPSPTTNDQ